MRMVVRVSDLKARVEAVLFSSDTSLSLQRLEQILEVDVEQLRIALQELQHECQQEGRGVVLHEVAGGSSFALGRSMPIGSCSCGAHGI